MYELDQLVGDIRQESCVFCRLQAKEPWRIQKSDSPVAPFYAVLLGELRVVTEEGTYDLQQGDFLVLPRGQAHEIMGLNSGGSPSIPLLSLFAQKGIEPWKPGMRYRTVRIEYGGEGATSVFLVGLFYFGDPRTHPLLGALPSALTLRANRNPQNTWLRSAIGAIELELERAQPASSVIVAKYADLMFTQALRAYLDEEIQNAEGWLRGISDPIVGAALSAMHAHPERPWTLEALAERAGCSRAVFAKRFSSTMGQGALGYLTSWRMHVAASLLRNGDTNIANVANRVGYRADAFSNAFRRFSGISPKDYRANSRIA